FVRSVAFSPDGRTLASGSLDTTIKLWDVQSQGQIATLTGHSDVVYSVAFSPDGRTLASGSWDTTIKLWKRQ
ncbi:MAG: serine/threonine protein kinase, partial [Planktothrix rubescens PR222]